MFSKRPRIEEIPSTKEYTSSILSRIACKGYKSAFTSPIVNHRIVFNGMSSIIDSGDALFKIQDGGTTLKARSTLNGLYLPDNFDYSTINTEHTNETQKIWKMFQFYGASIKSHVNESSKEIDEPVAMICGMMSVINRSPTKTIPFGSMLFYHFPDPNQDQSYGYQSLAINKVFERLPLSSETEILNKTKVFQVFSNVHIKDDVHLAVMVAFNILQRLNFDRDTFDILSLYGMDRIEFGHGVVHHTLKRFNIGELLQLNRARTVEERGYLNHTFWLLQDILHVRFAHRHTSLLYMLDFALLDHAEPDIKRMIIDDDRRVTRYGAIILELTLQLMGNSVDIYQNAEVVELTRRMYTRLPIPKADFKPHTNNFRHEHEEYYKNKSVSYKTLNCLIKTGLELLGLRFAGVAIENARPGGKYLYFQYPGMRQIFQY